MLMIDMKLSFDNIGVVFGNVIEVILKNSNGQHQHYCR